MHVNLIWQFLESAMLHQVVILSKILHKRMVISFINQTHKRK